MSDRAWMSGIMGDSSIGDKQGIRIKYYNTEWEPAKHQIPLKPPHVWDALNKYYAGYALTQEELPEAIALWNRGCFRRTKELFMGGFVYAVRGKLAEVLSEFNLGEKSGLVPFDIIQDDVKTPLDGQYYYVNWDGHKDTFLPEKSQNVELFARNVEKDIEWWDPTLDAVDKDIALSSSALLAQMSG
ncbi:MAG: hypothetical protein ACRCTD_16190 [Beijerinckiaceae bacterium]